MMVTSSNLMQRLLAACKAHPDAPALCSASRTLTYRALGNAIDDAARMLGRDAAGQRILLRVQRSPDDLAVLFFACLAAGAVPALADPVWSERECRELAHRTGCTRWIGDEPWPGDARFDLPGATVLYAQSIDADPSLSALDPKCGFIRYSSGSTGLPRAIAYSCDGALAIADAWAEAARLTAADRILCLATLNNGLAFNTTLLPGLLAGAALRLESRFLTAKAVLAAAREHVPTIFIAFPLVYEFVAKRSVEEVRAAFHASRLRLSSAAALGSATKQAWHDVHGLPIGNYYGIAEVGPVTFNDGSDAESMGRPLADVRIQTIDRGVSIVTPWMGLGYVRYSGDEDDAALSAGQPYVSSDRVATDVHGNIQLLGRTDDVVNLNGKKVALSAVRAAVAPLVGGAEFAVIATYEEAGSYLCVHVEASPLSVAEIQAACARTLPPYVIPRRVVLHTHFPRSSAGKVLVGQLSSTAVHPTLSMNQTEGVTT